MHLTDCERKVYDWLCDNLSKELFLTRKQWSSMIAENEFSKTHSTVAFEKFFLYESNGENLYCPLSRTLELCKENKVIVFGNGRTGKAFIDSVARKENIVAVYDNHAFEGATPVPKQLCEFPYFDYIIVTVLVTEFRKEIIHQLLQYGVEREKILCPFVIDEEKQYFEPGIIEHAENEIFIDGGVFDFGTSRRLLRFNPSVKKIYAYEPDEKNYAQVMQAVEQMNQGDVRVEKLAWWNKEATLSWNSRGGAARVQDQGEYMVQATTIDKVCAGEEVTFIKMDLEGSEKEALQGAALTIQKYKPKLAISVYHKPEDYYLLANYICSLRPDYRGYMRHYSSGADDTVLYCV